MAERLLEGLNEAQREAVTHPGGPLLVLAGAGSGKTRVITRRIAWLAEQGIPPENVLALTFSTKAAEEMRSRAEELLENPYEELVCTTFHSFCVRVLQEEAVEAGFDPFFHPATPADRLALMMERLDSLDVRHHDMRGNPAPFLAKLIERIDRLKDEMVPAAEYLAWAESLASSEDEVERDSSAREAEFARLYADHDRLLDESGAMDFGEMIVRAIRLLDERPAARRRVSRALPRRARGRVPGHQLRPAAAAAPAGRRPRQRGGGRRRRPVDLPVPGRLPQEHRRLPADASRTPR